ISKGLQHRSEAICKAITHYNVQATALTPPHLVVSWKDIGEGFDPSHPLVHLSLKYTHDQCYIEC
ncbi:hypothetical protein EDC04DRAFT_2568881, partial [Pisolithus marmoratus]